MTLTRHEHGVLPLFVCVNTATSDFLSTILCFSRIIEHILANHLCFVGAATTTGFYCFNFPFVSLILSIVIIMFAIQFILIAGIICNRLASFPHFTRPVSSLGFWSGTIAVVTRTEVSPSVGVISFDFHVRVAKSYNDNFTTFILDIDCKLLRFFRSPKWFVQCDLSTLVFCGR